MAPTTFKWISPAALGTLTCEPLLWAFTWTWPLKGHLQQTWSAESSPHLGSAYQWWADC